MKAEALATPFRNKTGFFVAEALVFRQRGGGFLKVHHTEKEVFLIISSQFFGFTSCEQSYAGSIPKLEIELTEGAPVAGIYVTA